MDNDKKENFSVIVSGDSDSSKRSLAEHVLESTSLSDVVILESRKLQNELSNLEKTYIYTRNKTPENYSGSPKETKSFVCKGKHQYREHQIKQEYEKEPSFYPNGYVNVENPFNLIKIYKWKQDLR